MSEENSPEIIFDIDTILKQFISALTNASRQLEKESRVDQTAPYEYHIPKMSISLNMELSYGKDKVKGIFRKSKASESSTMQSRMTIDVVSVPRLSSKA